MNKLKKILLLTALCTTAVTYGQDPASLYFMEMIPQTNYLNPAHQPRANVFVTLVPFASYSFNFHSDLALRDILQKQGDKWYLPVEEQYDFDKLYHSIGRKATAFNANIGIDLLGFGFRTRKGNYFTFGLSEQVLLLNSLPSDMFRTIENGFPDNSSFDFSPMRVKEMAYLQMLVGYSRKINDRLTVGINLKPLFGQAVMSTHFKEVKINTSTSEWNVAMDGEIQMSAPGLKVTEGEKYNDFPKLDFDTDDISYVGSALNFSNPGLAIDLGATYRFNEDLTFSASLTNLGFIAWTKNASTISANGNYRFSGLDVDIDTDFDKAINSLGDSLEHAFTYGTEAGSFTTSLPPILYLGAEYQLTTGISAGFLSRSIFWKKAFRQSFHLSLNLQPYSFVAFNLTGSYQVKGNVYLGSGFTIYMGPLQFYMMSDYIPLRYSNVSIDGGTAIPLPERQKNIQLRLGFNLLFGKNGYRDKPMVCKGPWVREN